MKILNEVSTEIKKQISFLKRKTIAERSISNSKIIYFENEMRAIEFINTYAPEHYMICMKDEKKFIESVSNSGSVFIGNFTPESAGDYISGTNHVLPTGGYSKQYSGVHLDSFLKAITFQKISKDGIKKIGNNIEIMAAAEGLSGHKDAVSLRLKRLRNEK